MTYASPVIVSTTSLVPALGTAALWVSPIWAVCTALVAAVGVVIAFPIPVLLAIALVVAVVPWDCVFKATYARPAGAAC